MVNLDNFALVEENMLVAADSRWDSFWVAFIIQGVNQPYKRSQKVSKSPF
jgi:hypothetical protein